MAIAFARISYHSRSQGHSAVAGAAYRSGAKLIDRRTGETHNFKNRNDVIYSKLLLPEGASSHLQDRETFWNLVEAAERRKNSQVAKDVVIALPRDLDLSHHIDLAQNFAHYHFVQHGIPADISIHDDQEGNPHAHIYVTTRRLIGGQFDKHKARDLEPDVVRGRVVDPQYWGEQWREFQNQYFKNQQMDLLVDANYIVSQRHEGRVTGGGTHYLKQENELRKIASVEVAVNDPNSVLNLLGTKHAVFSERDIAMLLHKNTNTKAEYDTALLNLKKHRDLIALGPGDDGRDRYTTRANYQREALMGDQAKNLNLTHYHPVKANTINKAAQSFGLNEEQTTALFHIAQSGDISATVGRAGTGKSYMMRAARQLWESSGYRVLGMAVSGIAAKGLEASTGIRSPTIHSTKLQLSLGSLELSKNDVLVMDEAGMTDLNDMATIVHETVKAGAKLVLVGDHAQLQPVGPGAPFRAIVEQVGFAELNQIQRQESSGDCQASISLSSGKIGPAIDHYAAQQQIHLVPASPSEGSDDGSETTISRLIIDWAKGLQTDTLSERLILAHQNTDVDKLNLAAREVMREKNLLGEANTQVKTSKGLLAISPGERILFLRNCQKLKVSNGEFGIVTLVSNNQLTVSLNDERVITFSTDDYSQFNYGYAVTVHKSQGATFNQSFVYVAGRCWDRFLTYVALTRHRKSLNIYASIAQFPDLETLKSTLSRTAIKDTVLDWPLSFAIRRGFDPDSMAGRFINKAAQVKQSIFDKWLFIANYSAFKTEILHRQSLKNRQYLREKARKVALFVDLRNNLAAQASVMHQDLKKGDKFYQHHDYQAWFEKRILKNKLAYEIKQQLPIYQHALELNRIDITSLDKLCEEHQCASRIKNYLELSLQGKNAFCYRLADQIQADFSRHYPYLMHYINQAGVDKKELFQRLEYQAERYRRFKVLRDLDPKEGSYFRQIEQFVAVDKQVRLSVYQAYQLGGFDKLSKADSLLLAHQKSRCDKACFELAQHIGNYSKALEFYGYDETRLIEGAERHQLRTRVAKLDSPDITTSERDEICFDLLSNWRYLPFIAERSLDWKQLKKNSEAHYHRDKICSLPAEKRHYYWIVRHYTRARIHAAKAWSQLFADKAANKPVSTEQWQFTFGVTTIRDRLAHDIVTHFTDCVPFVEESLLKLTDIEKHAIRYNQRLLKEQEKRHNKSQISPSHSKTIVYQNKRLDKEAINEALLRMGKDFYRQVLGDQFRNSGNHIRFGAKGSLIVTIAGPYTGSWHSFETGEGGGPLQLLMNNNHGWGLSFMDALKEGARLSGITQGHYIVSVAPKPAPQSAPKEDKSDKIARARYYYRSSKPIHGTIGEKYLREKRGIRGNIDAFRFHPHIRDDRVDKDGNRHVSYHPGIVIGARNNANEITAAQTILLNLTTANKIDKNSVGAVKRTRGDLKGSSVQIQSGPSKRIIIAEGPETAASLMCIEPHANIYVTLGNINNASSLGWLSKKHQTKQFYFAADNDGENASNLKLLKKVAQSLYDNHGIQSYQSIPNLPNQKKCDFNDVLINKGTDVLKFQFLKMKPIAIKKPDKRQVIEEKDVFNCLTGFTNEWKRLEMLRSKRSVESVLVARERLIKATGSLGINIQRHNYEQAVNNLCRDRDNFTRIKSISPNLAILFKQLVKPVKKLTIDWLSNDYINEFDELRKHKEKPIQYLVRFRDKLSQIKEYSQEKPLIKQINSAALMVLKCNKSKNIMGKIAPKLTGQIVHLSRQQSKTRDLGRDL